MKHFFLASIAAIGVVLGVPGAEAAITISSTAPTSSLLLSQASTGGSLLVESEQGTGTYSDGVGQSFTPTGGGWELEALTIRTSSIIRFWDAADKAMVVVIDNVSLWKTQSWGNYTDVLGYGTTVGGVNILDREEFDLTTVPVNDFVTFNLDTSVTLASGEQHGFLIYLNSDNDTLWHMYARTAGIDEIPGESVLYSLGSDNESLDNVDMVFFLQGYAVPEPGIGLLAAVGGIAGLMRRQR